MQASDKVEFVQYLEKNGVIDVLTKALVSLFEGSARPEDPLNTIKTFLNVDENLLKENAALKQRIQELEQQVEQLKKGPEAS
mmetsp:Transcript_10394/g.17566  ORF Transcript_10394/g.17566 Transcript_10394/m.17566 type:complete len:82 (-) Transcript_10394:15-260(-)|eukprot:CAMPEP_0184348334 /NCGR_PEP_ID=MMETSP1089-20130417/27578_1 /TAXON_ID=38269 ORGANISM="Gloeochaete wittrockiana, Strain SAG46.84" /NCGR_SAMPLE_ID=MMETSP1089 /ASSEMBLY_ACC=CAM_ASM_000445 /LENGTH=81 /DNA_ID=CAMNT_0026679993 /DNA_START=28 /DNA_END=273 /DNA_ORIENTATION=+